MPPFFIAAPLPPISAHSAGWTPPRSERNSTFPKENHPPGQSVATYVQPSCCREHDRKRSVRVPTQEKIPGMIRKRNIMLDPSPRVPSFKKKRPEACFPLTGGWTAPDHRTCFPGTTLSL